MSNIKIVKSGIFHALAIASIALLIGEIFRCFIRPQNDAAFLALLTDLPLNEHLSFLIQWPGWLPSFIYFFAFSLLSYWALGLRHLLFFSLLWCAINSLFRLGQALLPGMIRLLPDAINIQSYQAHRVFDMFGLLACLMGTRTGRAIFHNHHSPNKESFRICTSIKNSRGLKNPLGKERCHE